jgi:hypothetical protein
VLAVSAVQVSPVTADKKGVTEFQAPLTNETTLRFDVVQTGSMFHYLFVNSYKIAGGGPMLEGGTFVLTFKLTDVPANSQYSPTWFSGPWNVKWRIVTSGAGEFETGWEGTAHSVPGSMLFTGTGNGFGEYKNMHVQFTYVEGSLLAEGEIWE